MYRAGKREIINSNFIATLETVELFLLLTKNFDRYENNDMTKVIMVLTYIVDVIGRSYSKCFILKSRRVY